MRLTIIFGFLFALFAIAITSVYFLVPFETVSFQIATKNYSSNNYNFSLNSKSPGQFYDNMRYPSSEISYRIENCSIQKKYDMERAFETIQNQTILRFYPVNSNEEIYATCENAIKTEERFFVAGEGGPTNITKTNNFNVILHGGILLLRDSNCERPNIAIHELLHALGFDHSQNPNNVMYNISRCGQTIGDDIIGKINQIYSMESEADLSFENASASMRGRYLNLNAIIRNNGLKDSESATLIIFANNRTIKEAEIEPIKIGYGLSLNFGNIFVPDFNVRDLRIEIDTNFSELDKNNNEIRLEIKNKN